MTIVLIARHRDPASSPSRRSPVSAPGRDAAAAPAPPVARGRRRRILFPFVGRRALAARARRRAAAGASPRTPRSSRCSWPGCRSTFRSTRRCRASARMAMPLLEAIEQRATEAGVPVDSRIERGRNRRHALRRAIAQERFDRIVIAAAATGKPRLRRRRRRLAARQRRRARSSCCGRAPTISSTWRRRRRPARGSVARTSPAAVALDSSVV